MGRNRKSLMCGHRNCLTFSLPPPRALAASETNREDRPWPAILSGRQWQAPTPHSPVPALPEVLRPPRERSSAPAPLPQRFAPEKQAHPIPGTVEKALPRYRIVNPASPGLQVSLAALPSYRDLDLLPPMDPRRRRERWAGSGDRVGSKTKRGQDVRTKAAVPSFPEGLRNTTNIV